MREFSKDFGSISLLVIVVGRLCETPKVLEGPRSEFFYWSLFESVSGSRMRSSHLLFSYDFEFEGMCLDSKRGVFLGIPRGSYLYRRFKRRNYLG